MLKLRDKVIVDGDRIMASVEFHKTLIGEIIGVDEGITLQEYFVAFKKKDVLSNLTDDELDVFYYTLTPLNGRLSYVTCAIPNIKSLLGNEDEYIGFWVSESAMIKK